MKDPDTSALAAMQRAFQRYVLAGDPHIAPQVAASGQGTSIERLRIYAEGYRLRLIEALETHFPALQQALGSQAFANMGRAYIDAFPSQYRSIRWFGEHLATFLINQQPFSEQPWLSELAAFEWAISTAFDAEDSPIVNVDGVAAVPPEAWPTMGFGFHASVRRLNLQWNVVSLRKASDQGDPLAKPTRAADGRAWIVWRQGLESRYRSLQADEAWALDCAHSGGRFEEICEGLCRWLDAEQVALRAASLLRGWISDGLINQLRLD